MSTEPDVSDRAVPARLVLFGYAPAPVRLVATARSRGTRTTRALLVLGATVLLAPLAALLPPHLPWALAVLTGGSYLAWRQWRGGWRVESFEGACPACTEPLTLEPASLITLPERLTCYACHQEPRLEQTSPHPDS